MEDHQENKSNSAKGKQSLTKNTIDFNYSASSCKDMKHIRNLEESFNELKNNTVKTRKCFSVYKLSTYFTGDKEFTTAFGLILNEVEDALEKMSEILKKNEASCIDSVKKELFKKSEASDITTLTDGVFTHSLTPPPSEIGNEPASGSSTRKRKLTANNAALVGNVSPIRKAKKLSPNDVPAVVGLRPVRETRVSSPAISRRQSSSRSTTPMPAAETKDKKVSHEDKEEEKKEEDEFEVDKVKDFVKKQGKEFFTVGWKGYDSNDDTLEPAEHLYNCDEILEKFFLTRIEERNLCQSFDSYKVLQFPSDIMFREALFNSFKKALQLDAKEILKRSTLAKVPILLKTKEDMMELVNKVAAYREPSMEKYRKMVKNLQLQFGMYNIQPQRQKQLAKLRTWERNINLICNDPSPITVENTVDLDLPPLGFVYINDQRAGPNICIPKDPMIGCSCTDCHSSQNNCCPKGMDSFFAYTKNGKLKVSLGTPIYECNNLCACSQDCSNRVVQKGRRIPLAIFRTDNGRGWGVKAQEFIRKDSFVTEYVGEVISSEEAEQRGTKYDAKGCTYLFDLDYNRGDLNPYTIDAAKYGNVSHFINHCCDPNLYVFNVWVNCLDPDLPRLALFANRDIRKGEELTFDYNSGSTRQQFDALIKEAEDHMTTPKKSDSASEQENIVAENVLSPTGARPNRHAGTTKCLCGAPNCRESFF